MPFPLPHHSKKHTVNNLLGNIFYSIYKALVYNAKFAWMPDLTVDHYSSLDFQIVGLLTWNRFFFQLSLSFKIKQKIYQER